MQTTETTGGNWIFGQANWGNFTGECDTHQISNNMNTDIFNRKIMQGKMSNALSFIPQATGRTKKK